MKRARISPTHNGNQDAVLEAVRTGHCTFDDVRIHTGLDYNAVRTALTRLSDRNLITRNNGIYHVVKPCLLAQVWTGLPEPKKGRTNAAA